MPWATDEQVAERNRRLGLSGAMAEEVRFREQGGVPIPRPSFWAQTRAAFEQENLFLNAVGALRRSSRVFGDEPGFDPEANLGGYSAFVGQFPELLEARSQAEMASIKNRIDREAANRRTLEGMGFWRALAVFGPATLLSPENALPIGTAIRGMGIVGKAARTGLAARAAGAAARTGLEAAGTQAVAEAFLQPLQGFRTAEEGAFNIVGAGLFGSVLGGAAGGIGAARSRALRELMGRETLTEVGKDVERAVAKVMDPETEVGKKFTADLERYLDRAEDVAGPDKPVDELTIFEDSPGVLAFGEEDPFRGRLMEALESDNPKLARLVGAENRIARTLFRALVFSPAMRNASSKTATTRLIQRVLTGHYITKDVPEGARGLSVEGAINLFDMGARRIQIEQYRQARELMRGPLKGIDEDRVWEMVGEARRLGDKVGDTPAIRNGVEYDQFAPIRGNAAAIAGIEKLSALHRDFDQLALRTAEVSGAYTKGPKAKGRVDNIMAALDLDHLSRMIDRDWVEENQAQFIANIKRGLEARIPIVLPKLKAEKAELESQLANATDKVDVDYLQEQIRFVDEAIGRIENPNLDDLAYSVESNYRPHAPGEGVAQQNPFMPRVLDIDERYLGDALTKDVRVLQNRMIRSILPDLVLAERMDAMLGGGGPLQRELAKTLAEIDSDLEKARLAGPDSDAADALLVKMGDARDKAAMLRLINNARLLRGGDVKVSEFQKAMQDVFAVRKRERARRATLKKQHREVRQEIAAWKEVGEDVTELEAKAAILRESIAESQRLSAAATKPADDLARKIAANVGNEAAHKGRLTFEQLAPRRGDLSLEGAETPEQIMQRLDAINSMIHAQVAAARRDAYSINVGTEHLSKAIERAHMAANPNMDRKARRVMEREQTAVETEVLRMRNKHGLIENDVAEWGKRVRDLSYMTKMGSVVLSSIPDLAMAIGTAGFVPYANALAKNLKFIFNGEIPKNTLAEWIYAVNRAGAVLRTEKMYGVEDEMVPRNRFDRGMAGMKENFTKWTGIRRWNAFNRAVASQAIESRVVKTILAGEKATKQDLNLIRFFGINDDDLPDLKKLLERTHTKDGLHYANVNKWRSENPEMADFKTSRLRNLRLQLDGAILKGVHDTILEPSAGDLPTIATKHPLGRMLFQFRAFSFAAMNRFLIPGLQRTAERDARPAFSAALATLMGMAVYAASQHLKGEDPFKETVDKDGNVEPWQKRWIWEGIDRGGALGILTEAASSLDKVMELGLLDSSRFRSRNKLDAFLGPAAGTAEDLLGALSTFSDGDVTHGEVARMRRLLPYQNLLILRAFLDLAPNLPQAGSGQYFQDFLKADERLAGFEGYEVN